MAFKRERLSDQVLIEIQKIIQEKHLAPGDKFHSESELAAMFDVSRSSVREAVRLLEASGEIIVQQGKGIFISDPRKQERDEFTEWLRENETTLEEHFEIRLIIDPKAAGYAARRADKSDIAKLEEICMEFKTKAGHVNIIDMIKLDERFHLQLAKSTKNRTLHMIMKTMTQALPEGWISSLNIPGRIEKSVYEHQSIIDAVKLGDARLAEQRMEEHLRTALDEIHAALKEGRL